MDGPIGPTVVLEGEAPPGSPLPRPIIVGQQLLKQQHVTIVGSIDFDTKIDKYQNDVAQF